jgi:hypothetical protein
MKALEILKIAIRKAENQNLTPYQIEKSLEAIAELELLQSEYEAVQLQYHKLWGMYSYSDLKKQSELATKDLR